MQPPHSHPIHCSPVPANLWSAQHLCFPARAFHSSSVCVVLGAAQETGERGLGLLHSSISPWGHWIATLESVGGAGCSGMQLLHGDLDAAQLCPRALSCVCLILANPSWPPPPA